MCAGKEKCNCGCPSSSFDGHEDLEAIETSRYLDFDGDDGMMEDDDFVNLTGAAAMLDKLKADQTKVTYSGGGGFASSLQKLHDKKNLDDRVAVKERATEIKAIGKQEVDTTALREGDSDIKEDTGIESASMPSSPMEMGKERSNKFILIGGGLLLLGGIIFAVKKLRK